MSAQHPHQFDTIISGGRLVDGTGALWRRADVAIAGDRIAAIGNLDGVPAQQRIEAGGCIVCPGFIDTHSHADLALLTGREMEGRLRQGITTELLGQDGLSYAPADEIALHAWRRYLVGLNGDAPDSAWTWRTVGEFLQELEGQTSNAAYLLPHGAIRVSTIGWRDGQAQDGELKAMQALVEQGLEEGAAGLSTGLTYMPCSPASTAEMVSLCRPVAARGGVYVTHMRSYDEGILDAMDETIEIGRQSGAAVHISHLRLAAPTIWGLGQKVADKIDEAREAGIDVTFDLYPYTAGCAPLFALLPDWALQGGPDQILIRLKDRSLTQRMASEMKACSAEWTTYTLSNAPSLPCGDWDGVKLNEIATCLDMTVEAIVPLLLLESELDATFIAHSGSEVDNDLLFAHPACMAGSDGVLLGSHPHPRGYGAFPRILAHYVRDKKVLSWEEAIHKMSGQPAARLNLQDRGLLRTGTKADVVVLDPERVQDNATYSHGKRLATGIEWVFVNGQAVVENEEYREGHSGQVLRPLER
jgi:N-acyl-D-amino-acid deacylase